MSEFNEEKWIKDNINEILSIGIGRVNTCSGCHETVDGQETGNYPYSKVFECIVGSGCKECLGTGIVEADYTDYPLWEENQSLKSTLEQRCLQIEEMHDFLKSRGLVDDYLAWSQSSR